MRTTLLIVALLAVGCAKCDSKLADSTRVPDTVLVRSPAVVGGPRDSAKIPTHRPRKVHKAKKGTS